MSGVRQSFVGTVEVVCGARDFWPMETEALTDYAMFMGRGSRAAITIASPRVGDP